MKAKIKNFITVLVLFLVTLSYGQLTETEGKTEIVVDEIKVEDVKIEVSVDSAEEIESTFSIEDIEKIFDENTDSEEITFKIICNGEKMSNGESSSVSYSVKGNRKGKDLFIKSVDRIRKAAIKYYKNK